jgi:hypothetical protein
MTDDIEARLQGYRDWAKGHSIGGPYEVTGKSCKELAEILDDTLSLVRSLQAQVKTQDAKLWRFQEESSKIVMEYEAELQAARAVADSIKSVKIRISSQEYVNEEIFTVDKKALAAYRVQVKEKS